MKDCRILLVDDDADYLAAVSFFLCSKGYEVRAVSSGRDALKELTGVQIVFLDLKMPFMDGLTVLAEIRKVAREVPVILVTGHAAEVDINKASGLGIAGIFPKTDPVQKLESLIEVVLRTNKKINPSSH